MDIVKLFIAFLKFSQKYILLYSLPTNPITTILYTIFTYYGYTKLKSKLNLDLSKFLNKILIFLYSGCILGFINFCLENVWLTSFLMRYTFFNNGWLNQIYFSVPGGWFINYLRNLVYMLVLLYISHDVLKLVNFNKKTLIGLFSVSLYIVLIFFLTPSYNYIDWTYAISNNLSDTTILLAFLSGVGGKPLLAYTFYTLWLPKKKIIVGSNPMNRSVQTLVNQSLTLDVGCGSRPRGNVNIDLLVKDSDPIKNNLLQRHNLKNVDVYIPNFIVADARFLPFKNKIFNKTYCYHMMEHISEDWRAYEEFNRVTREEIEIRVPLGIWEDMFNIVFWRKHLKEWRKIHHLRSYSKNNFSKDLMPIFKGKNIAVSYGYLSFLKGLKFELKRETKFPFPIPFELIAHINLENP